MATETPAPTEGQLSSLETPTGLVSIGQRIAVDGSIGSVRYIGPVLSDKTQSTWIGVEWDDKTRGKHDGAHEGVRYFSCIHGGSGSFVKANKVDAGVDFATELRERYTAEITAEEEKELTVVDVKTNKVKRMEFVGKDKAQRHYKEASNLTDVALPDCSIRCGGDAPMCINLVSLALDGNLLSDWPTVLAILDKTPKLETLSLSRNRLKKLDGKLTAVGGGEGGSERVYGSVRVLALNQTLIGLQELEKIAPAFPHLRDLHMCNNNIASVAPEDVTHSHTPHTPPLSSSLSSLSFLNVDANHISEWHSIAALALLPSLRTLQANSNQLASSCLETTQEERNALQKVIDLLIEGNPIDSWSTFGSLAACVSSLRELRFMRMPIIDNVDKGGPRFGRQLAIALFPELQKANGSEVKQRDRLNSERYFLSLAAQKHAAVAEVDPQGEHTKRLTAIHGEAMESASAGGGQGPTLAQSLISVTLEPLAASAVIKPPATKKLPASMLIRDLRVLCAKLYGVPTTRQRLLFKDGDMPVLTELTDDMKDLAYFGFADGSKVRIEDTHDDRRPAN